MAIDLNSNTLHMTINHWLKFKFDNRKLRTEKKNRKFILDENEIPIKNKKSLKSFVLVIQSRLITDYYLFIWPQNSHYNRGTLKTSYKANKFIRNIENYHHLAVDLIVDACIHPDNDSGQVNWKWLHETIMSFWSIKFSVQIANRPSEYLYIE